MCMHMYVSMNVCTCACMWNTEVNSGSHFLLLSTLCFDIRCLINTEAVVDSARLWGIAALWTVPGSYPGTEDLNSCLIGKHPNNKAAPQPL